MERFGPTSAAEHLESEDGIKVDAETLRRWMLAEGLWSPAWKRREHRRRRQPRLISANWCRWTVASMNGMEQRAPKVLLMNLVDDATTQTLGRIGAEETIWTAARVLRLWVEQHAGTGGAVRRLEKRLRERSQRAATAAGRSAEDAVRTNVRALGNAHHCRELARKPKDGWSTITARIRIGW